MSYDIWLEIDTPAPEGAWPTPAQWIHRWNRATADERLAKVEQIFNDSDTATRCRYQDHGAVLHELANTLQAINRVRELHRGPRTQRHGSGCVQCGTVWPCPTIRALDGEAT